MKTIFLYEHISGTNVKHIDFPSGEKHIRIIKIYDDDVTIVCNSSTDELMKIGMAVDICRRNGVKHITLVMPFVPYARQDRVAVDGDPFSIKVFANFLNSLEIDKVVIVDPHSDVTPALINNIAVVDQHIVASKALLKLEELVKEDIAIVAPDIGAAKKAKALQNYLDRSGKGHYPIIQCYKTRCAETGKITGFNILSGDPKDLHCLIVDDICDGGGTFLRVAEILKQKNAKGQSLYVTHGIFSKGTIKLLSVFDYVFASDSIRSVGTDYKVITIPLSRQLYVYKGDLNE